MVEACKQCGRNRLMEIAEPLDFAQLLAEHGDVPHRLIAHPAQAMSAGEPVAKPVLDTEPVLGTRSVESAGPVVAAVGPEGGLSDAEVAAALGAGWQAVDLGRRILRVETAALALLTRFGDDDERSAGN